MGLRGGQRRKQRAGPKFHLLVGISHPGLGLHCSVFNPSFPGLPSSLAANLLHDEGVQAIAQALTENQALTSLQ